MNFMMMFMVDIIKNHNGERDTFVDTTQRVDRFRKWDETFPRL